MSEILNTNISLKENIKLLFSNLRYNESTHLGLGDIRLTIGLSFTHPLSGRVKLICTQHWAGLRRERKGKAETQVRGGRR